MALGATIHRFLVDVSDVDRGVYEALDLRVARHPSESLRYMLLRVLAYALSVEEGIAFSKGGLSEADEPPLSVRDATGAWVAWIDVGAPSAERMHKAAKLVPRVSIFTAQDLAALRREAVARPVHRAAEITVHRVDAGLLDALEPRIERQTKLELTRNEGRLYATVVGAVLEGAIETTPLVEA